MPTLEAVPNLAEMTIEIAEEIRVAAPISTTFAALLESIGRSNQMPNGQAMPMTIEAFPGGRWFRDLGNGNGHNWGHVQAIKSPTLLEISGPLMMSYPVSNNVQWRLSEENGETMIRFRHSGFGFIAEAHREGMPEGWGYMNSQAKMRAETK